MRRQWVRQVFFTLVEHGAIRVLDAATTLVLIRVMTADDFGLYSVYQSWVGLLLLLFPALDVALYREYGKLRESGQLARELSIYRKFNFLQLKLAVVLTVLLSFLPQRVDFQTRLALFALAFALPFFQRFYGYLRDPLRFELKQELVAGVGALQRLVLLGAIAGAALSLPSKAGALTLAALMTFGIFGWVWSYFARAFRTGARAISLRETLTEVRRILGSTAIWFHLSGVILGSIQTLDTFFLGSFRVTLSEIALYSIALKASNLFQMVPLALANSFGVYLGRSSDGLKSDDRDRRMMLYSTLAFVALGLVFVVLGFVVAEPVLAFLGRGKMDQAALLRTTAYFRWQLLGVLLLCSVHPLSTYLSARANLPRLFAWVNLPWFIASAVIYAWAASMGPLVAAKANVAVYGCFALLLAVYLVVWQRKANGSGLG